MQIPTVKVGLNISVDLHAKVKEHADRFGMPFSKALLAFVEEGILRVEEKHRGNLMLAISMRTESPLTGQDPRRHPFHPGAPS